VIRENNYDVKTSFNKPPAKQSLPMQNSIPLRHCMAIEKSPGEVNDDAEAISQIKTRNCLANNQTNIVSDNIYYPCTYFNLLKIYL